MTSDASSDLPTPPPPFHGRRLLLGFAVAGLLSFWLAGTLIARALTAEKQARAERVAVVTLSALTDLLERAGGNAAPAAPAPPAPDTASGAGMSIEQELAAATAAAGGPSLGAASSEDALRRMVTSFAEVHPATRAIRVLDLAERRLLASTAAADQGAQAAPRRLRMEEKPLYDLGNRLRAAVEGNRGAGAGARAPELSVERRPDGVLTLAAPVVRAGEVQGLVEMEMAPAEERVAFDGVFFLAVSALAVAFFAPIAWPLPNQKRRLVLAAFATILLFGGLSQYRHEATYMGANERFWTGDAIYERIAFEVKQVERLLPPPIAPPISPGAWDVDLLRQPRGLIQADGTIDESKLAAANRASAASITRAGIPIAVFALLLLSFIGFGGAARVGSDLVHFRVAYTYILPAMLGMLVLVFFPFFYGIALSFTNANIYNTNTPITEIWIGLQNFKDILGDFSVVHRTAEGLVFDYSNFYWTFGFTVVWTIANVAIGVTLGLILALILNTKGLAFRPIYRVILILPWAMPNYITALIWGGMFHPQFGVINQMIQIFGGHPIFWFSKPLTSFAAVLATNGWLSFPFMMVISLGALQSIPADLYEAAVVDGATRWQQFKSITLPSLKPALVPAVILSVIWTFNMFNIIFLVSAGEPQGATEILITKAYKLAFQQYRYGYAAAYSTVIFLILLIYGTWQNRVTGASEGIA